MARSLFERSDFISNFAAHVSHELKSPLTSIQGAAELLRDSEKSMKPGERKRFFNNIIGDTQRLTVLLQRLRELARADGPHTVGNTTLNDIADDLRNAFPSLAIDMRGDLDEPMALSSENMQIILSHLFDNAVQHDGTRIAIDVTDEELEVVITVGDNGQGISEHNQSKIFDSFFTTRRDQGGTGMGLGIVRTILHAHGGTIKLMPSKRGTEFEIRVPKGS